MVGGLGPDSAAPCWLCAGQRCWLALWLWSLHSGRALSQALASFCSPGNWQGWIIKCVYGAEKQENRDETEQQEIPSGDLQKERREERERERYSFCCLGLSWEEEKFGLRGPTYWNITVPQSVVENKSFYSDHCREFSILQIRLSTFVLSHFDIVQNFLIRWDETLVLDLC